MKIWLSLPFLGPHDLRTLALVAEELGLTGLCLSDHVCVPDVHGSPYPYGSGGPVTLPVDTAYPDPLIAAASLAAATERVRFMTAVLIAPLRHPVALAKAVATLASMAGGRFDLGVGVGWLREEFEAVGLDTFDQRGAVTDEMLPLLAQLWSGEPVAHEGRHLRFDAVAVNPTPPEPVPLFVGGHSAPALRRAARVGDGWVGVNPSIDELEGIVDRLHEARAEAGTADRPFEIRTGIKGALTDERVATLRDLEVDALLIGPWQVGERRESVFDQPVEAIVEGLPPLVERIRSAGGEG